MATCGHGYEGPAIRTDCPRCGDRPDRVLVHGAPRHPHSRWDATTTTLGPRLKVAITCVVVLPLLFMLSLMRYLSQQPLYILLVVPIAGLVIFDVRFLPEVWETGRVIQNGARAQRSHTPDGSQRSSQ